MSHHHSGCLTLDVTVALHLAFGAATAAGMRPPPGGGGGSTPPPNPAIAYADKGIRVMNADGTNQRTLVALSGSDWARSPAWSPNDAEIVFSGRFGGVAGVYAVPTAGGTRRLITPTGNETGWPDWSPVPTPDGGHWIAFVNSELSGTERNIHLVRPDGTGRLDLTGTVGDYELSAAWSPDGRRLALERFPDGVSDPELVILDIDAVGGLPAIVGATVVYTDLWGAGWARWANTSETVVFAGVTSGLRIATLDLSDPFAVPVVRTSTGGSYAERTPSFAPDDSKIAFYRSGTSGGIFTMNANGTGQVRINSKGTEPVWRRRP